jgi:hypothetical protein
MPLRQLRRDSSAFAAAGVRFPPSGAVSRLIGPVLAAILAMLLLFLSFLQFLLRFLRRFLLPPFPGSLAPGLFGISRFLLRFGPLLLSIPLGPNWLRFARIFALVSFASSRA